MTFSDRLARTARETGFLLGGFPFAVTVFSLLQSVFWTGIGTLIIGVGLVIGAAALWTARGTGAAWRSLVIWADGRSFPAPPAELPARPGERAGLRRFLGVWRRPSDWRALLHQGLLGFVLSTFSFSLAITWVSGALGGLTYGVWARFLPVQGEQVFLSELIWTSVTGRALDRDPLLVESGFLFVVGLLFLVTLPPLFRGLTAAHWAMARGLLGETAGDALRRDVAVLEAARGAATSAEHRTLGQLERDLHDGPQQRLVRLQMDLSAAERRIGDDPEAAAQLLSEARETAQDTLDELRALSRGFAPPILGDRGLPAALEALAARAPLPIDLTVLPGGPLAPELERTLYFVAAELVANAAKHSGAQRVEIRLAPGGDGGWELRVSDAGVGGAMARPGHGLAGLAERMQGVGGSLRVQSPAGGPTVVTAAVPVS